MERFVRGEVVILSFPYSDFSFSKRRPALVLTNLRGNDLILCQITSQNKKDGYSVKLEDKDFDIGSLKKKF